VGALAGKTVKLCLQTLDAPVDLVNSEQVVSKACCWPGSWNAWRPSHARRVVPQHVVGIVRSWRRQNFPSR
jgi:hypothetical protein